MKVAIITTVRHNVGDDFVREGILHLLGRAAGAVEPLLIHKHFPLSVRPEWEWLHRWGVTRMLDRLPGLEAERWSRRIDRLPLRPQTDKILSSDLLVQCGAPVYWVHGEADSSRNEWYEPLINRRWCRVSARVPFLNLGAGACQSYDSDGSEFARTSRTLAYIRELHARCRLTTVRDRLSGAILVHAGLTAPLLPCPSLFARDRCGVEPAKPEFIALNFMKLGGHYQYDTALDAARWRATFAAFARQLARRERCVLVCHDRDECREAAAMLPEIERFHARDYRDYLRFYARASCGVVNRVHAAFALASFGRPALVVGNDSRARMTDVIGLPSLYVARTTTARLEDEFFTLRRRLAAFDRLITQVRSDAAAEYHRLLRAALRPAGEDAIRC